MQQPTIGRIVHYTLSAADAHQINARRTTNAEIQDQVLRDRWPLGAQAHLGNIARAGDVLPAIVVRVLPQANINARVLLDGTDVYWATTRGYSEAGAEGFWHWPPRA